jgi:hypothetical protein
MTVRIAGLVWFDVDDTHGMVRIRHEHCEIECVMSTGYMNEFSASGSSIVSRYNQCEPQIE